MLRKSRFIARRRRLPSSMRLLLSANYAAESQDDKSRDNFDDSFDRLTVLL